MKSLLRVFFKFLYHQLAFTYDLVAGLVSLGHWKVWILEVIPFIKGNRTLELGHGPGHLHCILLSRGLIAVAMDESAQMGRLARSKLVNSHSLQPDKSSTEQFQYYGYAQANLTRGLAQHLPFHDKTFDTVIATFPAEYIADPLTMSEVERCLSDGGRFVVLPVAMPKNRFLSWLFRVTGQAPAEANKLIQKNLMEMFSNFDYNVETYVVEKSSGTLFVVVATKTAHAAKDLHAQKTS